MPSTPETPVFNDDNPLSSEVLIFFAMVSSTVFALVLSFLYMSYFKNVDFSIRHVLWLIDKIFWARSQKQRAVQMKEYVQTSKTNRLMSKDNIKRSSYQIIAPSNTKKSLLIIGSSVSYGEGASDTNGKTDAKSHWIERKKSWTHRLGSTAIDEFDYDLVVCASVPGSASNYWRTVLELEERENLLDIGAFSTVVLSLSLGNEGLAGSETRDEARILKDKYIENVLHIIEGIRFLQTERSAYSDREEAGNNISNSNHKKKLIVGGCYPNENYSESKGHVKAIEETNEKLFRIANNELSTQSSSSCSQKDCCTNTNMTYSSDTRIDSVIDFLKPVVHRGNGKWHDGAWYDAGHPNDVGHGQMFECIDLQTALGRSGS